MTAAFDPALYARDLLGMDDAALIEQAVTKAVAYLHYTRDLPQTPAVFRVVAQLRQQVKATEAECGRRGIGYDGVVAEARKRRAAETKCS